MGFLKSDRFNATRCLWSISFGCMTKTRLQLGNANIRSTCHLPVLKDVRETFATMHCLFPPKGAIMVTPGRLCSASRDEGSKSKATPTTGEVWNLGTSNAHALAVFRSKLCEHACAVLVGSGVGIMEEAVINNSSDFKLQETNPWKAQDRRTS